MVLVAMVQNAGIKTSKFPMTENSGSTGEVFDSIWNTFRERVSSPLIGVFSLSWIVFNYRFFIVIFSDNSVSETFRLIDEVIWPSKIDWFIYAFIYPSCAVLFYVFVYPRISTFVYKRVQIYGRNLNDERIKINDAGLATSDEAKAFRQQIRSLKIELDSIAEQKNQEIDKLREQLAEFKSKADINRDIKDALDSPNAPPLSVSGDTFAAQGEVSNRPSPDFQALLELPVTRDNLIRYLLLVYPDRLYSETWLDRIIRDLRSSRFITLRHIDQAIASAKSAIIEFSARDPSLFEFSTDFLSKSLGLVSDDFLKKHGFSSETRLHLLNLRERFSVSAY